MDLALIASIVTFVILLFYGESFLFCLGISVLVFIGFTIAIPLLHIIFIAVAAGVMFLIDKIKDIFNINR